MKWRHFEAPADLDVHASIDFLAQQVLASELQQSQRRTRKARNRRSLLGRSILRGDPGVNYILLSPGSNPFPDIRFVVRMGSHWLPFSISVFSTEGQRQSGSHFSSYMESAGRLREILGVEPETLEHSFEGGRITMGTPEQDQRLHEWCMQRKQELLASTTKPLPNASIQPLFPGDPWRCTVVRMALDMGEDQVGDHGVLQRIASAFGARGPLIEISQVVAGLYRFHMGEDPNSVPPAGESWKDYVRMLMRRGRFHCGVTKSMIAALQR